MQKSNISFDALTATASAATPRNLYWSDPFLSPASPANYLNSSSTSVYAFRNYSPSSMSDTASFDGGESDRRLHDSSSILEYQQLYNRHTICLTQLQDTMEEMDALRRENESIRLSNADLSHRVALLFSRDRLLSEFSRLNIASPSATPIPSPVRVASPQSLSSDHNRFDPRNAERVSLPKSISVRSRGYLNMTRPSRDTPPQKTLQRVCVPGTKKEEEEALELDVYNQGMLKTELCNKWQETGTCPYADSCQFAHGIKELRPVIRHPRYKTEVCRMVLAGDVCPYGHRCHFRHSLSEQERLTAMSPPPR